MRNVPVREEPPRLAITLIRNILPRALRGNYLSQLTEYYKSTPQFISEWAIAVIKGYRMQIAAACTRVVIAAELFVAAFCFGGGVVPIATGIAVGAVLGALILRDAYTHPSEGKSQKAVKTQKTPGHYLDGAADAAVAGLFLMAAQCLMGSLAPSMALTWPRFARGAILCLPTLATLRMLIRPKAPGQVPFEGSTVPPETLYWTTWRMNNLWLAAMCFTIWTNPIAIPSVIPFRGFMHGALPLATFAFWRRLQRDSIGKGAMIETLFRHHKDLKRKYMGANLFKGVKTTESIYPAYVILEVMFFLQLLAPLAADIWPWVSGSGSSVDVFRTFFNLSAFATLTLSWGQVKATNRAAAESFREALEAKR